MRRQDRPCWWDTGHIKTSTNPTTVQFIDPIFKIVSYLIYKFVITGFPIKTQKLDEIFYLYLHICMYIKKYMECRHILLSS